MEVSLTSEDGGGEEEIVRWHLSNTRKEEKKPPFEFELSSLP